MSSARERTVNVLTAAVMFAIALPVVALMAGLSVRLFRWVAG